jgi:hypothetical protein
MPCENEETFSPEGGAMVSLSIQCDSALFSVEKDDIATPHAMQFSAEFRPLNARCQTRSQTHV